MTVFHSATPRAVSHQLPRSARVAVVLAAATLASIAPALWAQPATPSWGVVDPKAAKAEADNFLQTRFLPLSETDPQAALALATNYLANSTLPSPARVALRVQIANHLYFNKANALPAQQRPAFTDAVLALVNEGISEVGDEPVSPARNASLLQMHEVALNILLDDKRWPAAQKQLEAAWPLALPMQDMSAWIERGKRLYREQEQAEKIAPMLIQTVQGRLVARKRLDLALCLQVSQQLAAQKQGEEALALLLLAAVPQVAVAADDPAPADVHFWIAQADGVTSPQVVAVSTATQKHKSKATFEEKAKNAQAMYFSGFHAARRSSGSPSGMGNWIMYESKCGKSEKIEHVWNQLNNGSGYEMPVRFYK